MRACRSHPPAAAGQAHPKPCIYAWLWWARAHCNLNNFHILIPPGGQPWHWLDADHNQPQQCQWSQWLSL